MALVSTVLEAQLVALAQEELTPEEANAKFATIITNYILSATITVNATGVGNSGAPVVSTGTGTIS